MKLEVKLPVSLWDAGERVGLRRYERAKEKGSRDSFGQDSAENHVYGARGEAAAAYAMGLEWPHARSIDGYAEVADLLPNWEIRTCATAGGMKVRVPCSPTRHKYCDQPERLVAFVFNDRGSPRYRMIGYVVADWAQRHRPLSDPGERKVPAHFVKMTDLAPFTEDFHAIHGWVRDPSSPSGWACAYCPVQYEGATP